MAESGLDDLATGTFQAPQRALRPNPPATTPPTHGSIAGRKVGRKWVVPVNLTEEARTLLERAKDERGKRISFGKLVIEALQQSEQQLKDQAASLQPASSSKWDDEIGSAEKLEGGRWATSLSISPGQAEALHELTQELRWSYNLTVDTAIRLHFRHLEQSSAA